jgi:peptidoglycan/xylan/chitin deacetylase (PgdA/CDA1 family)
MNNFLKKYTKAVRRRIDNWWSRPIAVFVNHQVSALFTPGIDCDSDWSSVDLYENNIAWILENYEVISLDKAIHLIESGSKIKKKYAVLTFDDGYASVLNALAILERYDLPATLFINSAYLDNALYSSVNAYNYIKAQPDEKRANLPKELVKACEYLEKEPSSDEYKQAVRIINENIKHIQPAGQVYLTYHELQSLNTNLFTIALHGDEHLMSTFLTDQEFIENVNKNIVALKNLSNYKPYFAFPFGNTDDIKNNIVESIGLKPVLCNGITYKRKDRSVCRIPVDGLDLSKLPIR